MAAQSKVGSFTLNAATGAQAITSLGIGVPNAGIFWVQVIPAIAGSNEIRQSIGVASSSTQRWAQAESYNGACTAADGQFRSDRCFFANDALSDVEVYGADFTSFDSDGFTINVTTGNNTVVVNYMVFSGVLAKAGTFDCAFGVTGNQSVTGVGFKPKATMFVSGPHSNDELPASSWNSHGWATDETSSFVYSSHQESPITTGAAKSRLFSDEIFGSIDSTGAENFKGTYTSSNVDGFTVNVVVSPTVATTRVGYLSFGGNIAFDIKTMAEPGSTGSQAFADLPFKPVGAMFISQGRAATSSASSDIKQGRGAASSNAAQRSNAYYYPNNNAVTTNPVGLNSTTAAFVLSSTTGTAVASMSLTTLDARGYTLNWTVIDGLTSEVRIISFGDSPDTVGMQTEVRPIRPTRKGRNDYSGVQSGPVSGVLDVFMSVRDKWTDVYLKRNKNSYQGQQSWLINPIPTDDNPQVGRHTELPPRRAKKAYEIYYEGEAASPLPKDELDISVSYSFDLPTRRFKKSAYEILYEGELAAPMIADSTDILMSISDKHFTVPERGRKKHSYQGWQNYDQMALPTPPNNTMSIRSATTDLPPRFSARKPRPMGFAGWLNTDNTVSAKGFSTSVPEAGRDRNSYQGHQYFVREDPNPSSTLIKFYPLRIPLRGRITYAGFQGMPVGPNSFEAATLTNTTVPLKRNKHSYAGWSDNVTLRVDVLDMPQERLPTMDIPPKGRNRHRYDGFQYGGVDLRGQTGPLVEFLQPQHFDNPPWARDKNLYNGWSVAPPPPFPVEEATTGYTFMRMPDRSRSMRGKFFDYTGIQNMPTIDSTRPENAVAGYMFMALPPRGRSARGKFFDYTGFTAAPLAANLVQTLGKTWRPNLQPRRR